jgi:hypothetical protein
VSFLGFQRHSAIFVLTKTCPTPDRDHLNPKTRRWHPYILYEPLYSGRCPFSQLSLFRFTRVSWTRDLGQPFQAFGGFFVSNDVRETPLQCFKTFLYYLANDEKAMPVFCWGCGASAKDYALLGFLYINLVGMQLENGGSCLVGRGGSEYIFPSISLKSMDGFVFRIQSGRSFDVCALD